MRHNIFGRVSYHAIYDDSILDALVYAHKNGFTGVQIADEAPHLSFERLSEDNIYTIQDFIRKTGINISLHGPDATTSLFASSKYIREGIIKYYDALFDFAKKIGAHVVTIHLGSMTIFPTDTTLEVQIPDVDLTICEDVLRQNLDRLVESVDSRFALCIENYNIEKNILDLLEPYLKNNRLYLCWDLAKSFGDPDIEVFFLSNLSKIKQVHLHDIRKVNGRLRSHRVIGTGEIDFKKYILRLHEADILDYCIEVRPREKALESLMTLRQIMSV